LKKTELAPLFVKTIMYNRYHVKLIQQKNYKNSIITENEARFFVFYGRSIESREEHSWLGNNIIQSNRTTLKFL
jgi:hypothetical protein